VLKERCPVPIVLENDGKCAALAEAWKGNLKDCKDGAAIVLGTGIGGGIIKDGKIHRGKHYCAGEFSSIIVREGNFVTKAAPYACSTEGLVEQAAILKGCSTEGMIYQTMMGRVEPDYAAKLHQKAVGPQYPDLKMNGFELFRLLEEGDPDINALYQDFIVYNVRMIINIVNIYDPERVVIGGGISKEPRLIADLQAAVKNITQYGLSVVTDVDLQPCYYRSSANLYGAMYNYLQRKAPELITH
jgi:predicted NBD/HSP70 family sugar kinase